MNWIEMKEKREEDKGGKQEHLKGRESWFSYLNQSTRLLWREMMRLDCKRRKSCRMMNITGKWSFKIKSQKF